MNKKELKHYKKDLLEKRDDLLQLFSNQNHENEENLSGDEADIASGSLEKELSFELSDNERIMLDNIEAALRKIDAGTFGSCESCKKPITKKRLKAIPFARFCIQCQAKEESP
ncbi:MAG: hypothetical protein GF384_07835 [Elusimicrobia bacterium]|nr:hypothetical protein [Elusimicrobiota bacterium]MBD3412552.1 hypothetical protein [Elusimicrobiota bacterium]